MRIYIVADMEGVSGVASLDLQAHPGAVLYEQSRRAMTAEVAGAAQGAFDGGADEVIVFDMHCEGLNLYLDELPAGTKTIVGKPGGAMLHAEKLGPMDGLMLVGFHTRPTNPAGMLSHTYTLYVQEMYLNDAPVGEVEFEAATAGSLGIPTLLVSGDAAMVEEVREFLPGAVLVDVKSPLSLTSAVSLRPADAAARIQKSATQAVRNAVKISPVATALPVELRLCVNEERFAAGFVDAGFDKDAQWLTWRGPSLLDAYAAFLAGVCGH